MLKEKKTIAAAESLTGGMFAERLISVAGASNVFPGGIVCYRSCETKLLGVSKETIESKGAVSEECAIEMADK